MPEVTAEHSFGVLRSDPRSGILDTNKDPILEMLGTHTERVRTICDTRHRVDSIRKEVQKHLLELHSIGLHWGKIVEKLSRAATRRLLSREAKSKQHRRRAHLSPLAISRPSVLFEHRPNACDDLGSAMTLVNNAPERRPGLFEIRLRTI